MDKLSPLGRMLLVGAAATLWSAVRPADYATWLFELLLGAAGVCVLVALRRRFPFSSFVYGVVAVHYVVLAIGAKYTYAEEPFFSWLRDAGYFSRNHFDRVGHFFQGLTPALLTRELLLRTTNVGRGCLLTLLGVSVALAFSACYELIEWWWVLAFYPTSGPEWLGMQGDPWDAQGDMLMALCGGLVSALLLARPHDRSLRWLAPPPAPEGTAGA
jgi:putative membrane protein